MTPCYGILQTGFQSWRAKALVVRAELPGRELWAGGPECGLCALQEAEMP